jgi:hypothetical protein
LDREKKIKLVAVLPTPVQVPSQWSLTQCVASITYVTNDKGDNDGHIFCHLTYS